MAIERPTFHESWYRVAELHPRLRTTVQISRQHFRGQPWHVVQDHTNNAFFRLAEPAYRFIALLDGRRTVSEAWKLVNEQLGDDAPTQGEAIQLLGQLYTSNLLQAEVTADCHSLFQRYKKRRHRELTGYLMNILFARLPLIDPDAFLERWLPLFGWIFSPVGLVVWLILLAIAIHRIVNYPHWSTELTHSAKDLLSPDNLLWLYLAFACIKACHEMGHAISCKKFGKQSGTGGEVHVIGIMLLVFTPVPYVDASSSWALQNKWHRAIVGAAGMWVELAIASIAAMIWAGTGDTGPYAPLHAFCYNVMFVASFSTVVFNANPLLRYDGYYILSDLLEIPNLGQRSKDYIYYLVKRYAWNVRFARNPAYSVVEEFWLFVYAVASFLMRAVVSFSIMFYLATVLNGALIVLAAGMAIAAVTTWILVPIGRFVHYLITSPELSRVRTRAISTTLAFTLLLVWAIGFLRVPDHAHAQGVVEPLNMAELFAANDGFVQNVPALNPSDPTDRLAVDRRSTSASAPNTNDSLALPSVAKDSLILAQYSPDLSAQLAELKATRDALEAQFRTAMQEDQQKKSVGQAQGVLYNIKSTDFQLQKTSERAAKLQLKAPFHGLLVIPDMEEKQYAYLKEGDRVGVLADLSHLIIRAAAANTLSGPLNTEASRHVQIRVNGRPDILLSGIITSRGPAGTNILPSPALGYQIGGEFGIDPADKNGTKTTESFFEVRIDNLHLEEAPPEIKADFDKTHQLPLLPGQRVLVRFDLENKSLARQAWTALLQLFQKKFKI
ncbi:MAG TPA: hypothetical protein VM008_18840 [Phycisphaerae bacterium]|nr:hypothetical protein [Phycisphaerae bacterium]